MRADVSVSLPPEHVTKSGSRSSDDFTPRVQGLPGRLGAFLLRREGVWRWKDFFICGRPRLATVFMSGRAIRSYAFMRLLWPLALMISKDWSHSRWRAWYSDKASGCSISVSTGLHHAIMKNSSILWDVLSTPTFEDVARFVAGPDAPAWLGKPESIGAPRNEQGRCGPDL